MKAAVVQQPGMVPIYGEFANPAAEPSEVAVRVRASALSQLARGRASGRHYSATGAFPLIAGVDGTGHLDDGRRVYFLLPRAPFGAMAEHTVVANGHWIALPDVLDDVTAAVIANPAMSSWAALVERARLRPGETVLVNGATGAAGQLAVRIARHLGAACVIATGRNEAVLATLGADVVVPIEEDERQFETLIGEQFAGRIDVVLDYLWGPTARSILVAGAKSGPEGIPVRFVQIGSVASMEVELPAAVFRSSSIELMGSGLGSVGLPRLLAAIDGAFKAATSLKLTLPHRAVPLADVATTWSEAGERMVYLTH